MRPRQAEGRPVTDSTISVTLNLMSVEPVDWHAPECKGYHSLLLRKHLFKTATPMP